MACYSPVTLITTTDTILVFTCMLAHRRRLTSYFAFFALDNGKRFFQLAKIDMLFLNLLGKERKRVLECTFLEVAVVTVHL